MAIRKKTLLLVLFGYLIGNIIPLLKVQTLIQTTDDSSARQTDCDCSRTRCTGKVDITESGIEKATDRQAIFNSKKRPRLLSQELSFRQPLFIGVVTARNLLSTRANAIYKTWGKLAPKLYFFSSPSLEKSHNLPIISLPGVDDTYPPQKKVCHHIRIRNAFVIWYNIFCDCVYCLVVICIQCTSLVYNLNQLALACPFTLTLY